MSALPNALMTRGSVSDLNIRQAAANGRESDTALDPLTGVRNLTAFLHNGPDCLEQMNGGAVMLAQGFLWSAPLTPDHFRGYAQAHYRGLKAR